jgi:tetratricopeptide (TPR) repeat protein
VGQSGQGLRPCCGEWLAGGGDRAGARLDGQGRYREALACQRRAVDLARASGDPVPVAKALCNLAAAHLRVEEFQTAADLCERAVGIAMKAGNAWVAAVTIEVQASALQELGSYDEALARALVGLGDAHAAEGAPELARECWQTAYSEHAASRHPAASRVHARMKALPPESVAQPDGEGEVLA